MDEAANQLAQEAWRKFQEIERAGGMIDAVQHGVIQEDIAKTRAERDRNIARRKDAITGVSEFPHIAEATAEVLAPLIAPKSSDDPKILVPYRISEPFEALRDAADLHPARPRIFLASLGTAADFTARATWAGNLFESGGIEAPQNDGFDTVEAIAEAFKQSGATLAVICSSDAVYGELAADAAAALAAAGAEHIYLAGRPNDALQAAGIGTFVYAGCDILAILQDAHERLGVSS